MNIADIEKINKMKFSDFNLSKNSDALLPVVVQDCTTLKVLMVAYMNEDAYNATVSTGKATFYSRSRQALWTKGGEPATGQRTIDGVVCLFDDQGIQVRLPY